MNKDTFQQIVATGKIISENELEAKEFTASNETSELADFCILMHPRGGKTSVGDLCLVESGNTRYSYRIHKEAITVYNGTTNEFKIYTR